MVAVTRYQPLVKGLDSLFDELFRPAQWSNGEYEPLPIRIDVKETAAAYAVHAELPGVKKEDIAIEVHGNEVALSAETRRDAEAKDGEKWLRVERFVGKTARSLVLPLEIDEARVEAKFADGVLELTLPKKPSAVARKVEIK